MWCFIPRATLRYILARWYRNCRAMTKPVHKSRDRHTVNTMNIKVVLGKGREGGREGKLTQNSGEEHELLLECLVAITWRPAQKVTLKYFLLHGTCYACIHICWKFLSNRHDCMKCSSTSFVLLHTVYTCQPGQHSHMQASCCPGCALQLLCTCMMMRTHTCTTYQASNSPETAMLQ